MGDEDERRRSRVEMENLSLDTSRFSRDLLQRFMGTSEKSEVAEREDIKEDELNLGLSLGGRFGVDKTSTNLLVRSSSIAACLPTVRDDDAVAPSSPPPVTCHPSSLMRTYSLPVKTEAEWRKRKELQSLRRMEAKRRRSEKVQRNLRGEKSMEDEKRGTDQMNLRSKLEKEQLLANEMFGCKLSTLAAFGADMGMTKGKESYLGSRMQEKRKPTSQGSRESQGGSSSSISELESKPAQGLAEANPPSIQSIQRDFGSRTPGGEVEITPSKRIDITRSRVHEARANTLGDMPCVFTKGDGPNGRTTDGILYKYGCIWSRKGSQTKLEKIST